MILSDILLKINLKE